jgi:hypothetical protein
MVKYIGAYLDRNNVSMLTTLVDLRTSIGLTSLEFLFPASRDLPVYDMSQD